MVRFCAIASCSNRSNRNTDKQFFAFPSVRDKRGRVIEGGSEHRDLWIRSLHSEDFEESKIRFESVCSDHFVRSN